MNTARLECEWARTSSLMALIANCHRDASKRSSAFEPREFNPMVQTDQQGPVRKVSMADLSRIVLGNERPEHVLAEIAAREAALKAPQ
jgi:hypothetical protein